MATYAITLNERSTRQPLFGGHQAISHRMTLVSSDTKFAFYRKQGLRLIENFK